MNSVKGIGPVAISTFLASLFPALGGLFPFWLAVDDFQTGNQQQIDDFKPLSSGKDNDRAAARRRCKKLRMLHTK